MVQRAFLRAEPASLPHGFTSVAHEDAPPQNAVVEDFACLRVDKVIGGSAMVGLTMGFGMDSGKSIDPRRLGTVQWLARPHETELDLVRREIRVILQHESDDSRDDGRRRRCTAQAQVAAIHHGLRHRPR